MLIRDALNKPVKLTNDYEAFVDLWALLNALTRNAKTIECHLQIDKLAIEEND